MEPGPETTDDELRPEFDLKELRGGVRAKYYQRYAVYVRKAIKAGLKDCQEGRTIPIAEVRQRLGLPD